jgi:putative transposase
MVNGCNIVKKLDSIKPLQVFCTDYTEIFFDNGHKKGYLMALLDHSGKLVPGYALDKRKNTDTALKAIKRASSTLKELGHKLKGKIIHHDQDPVYTGYKWMREVLFNQNARISYSENGARGNSIIEAFHSSLKRENKDLFLEVKNIWELKRIVKERIEYYKQTRRHSTLGQVSPLTYLKREKILPEERESLVEIGA